MTLRRRSARLDSSSGTHVFPGPYARNCPADHPPRRGYQSHPVRRTLSFCMLHIPRQARVVPVGARGRLTVRSSSRPRARALWPHRPAPDRRTPYRTPEVKLTSDTDEVAECGSARGGGDCDGHSSSHRATLRALGTTCNRRWRRDFRLGGRRLGCALSLLQGLPEDVLEALTDVIGVGGGEDRLRTMACNQYSIPPKPSGVA